MLHWVMAYMRYSPKVVTSPYILQRSTSLQLSILGHSSAPSISWSLCLVRQVPAAPSALPHSSPGRLLSGSPLSYPRPCGMILLTLGHFSSWWTLLYAPDLLADPRVSLTHLGPLCGGPSLLHTRPHSRLPPPTPFQPDLI